MQAFRDLIVAVVAIFLLLALIGTVVVARAIDRLLEPDIATLVLAAVP